VQVNEFTASNVGENMDDKPLLKIINQNDTFYLESTTYSNQSQLAKMSEDEKEKVGVGNYQNMYLVVRSLKHNNEKIVSFSLQPLLFLYSAYFM